MITSPLTPSEYYELTLQRQGLLEPTAEQHKEAELKMAALAEERGLPLEAVKLADEIYDQLQRDGLQYASPVEQREDALKIAEGYFDHLNSTIGNANKTASGLAEHLLKTAEAFCAEHEVDLEPMEALKAAAMQAEEELARQASLEEAEAQKTAALERVQELRIRERLLLEQAQEKEAAGAVPAGPADWQAFYRPSAAPHIMNVRKSALADTGFVQGAKDDAQAWSYLLGGKEIDKNTARLHSAGVARMMRDHGMSVGEATHGWIKSLEDLNKPPETGMGDIGGFISKNKVPLALGAGALFMLNRKRKKERAEEERKLEHMRAMALPRA